MKIGNIILNTKDVTKTGVVIPANTLQAGKIYKAISAKRFLSQPINWYGIYSSRTQFIRDAVNMENYTSASLASPFINNFTFSANTGISVVTFSGNQNSFMSDSLANSQRNKTSANLVLQKMTAVQSVFDHDITYQNVNAGITGWDFIYEIGDNQDFGEKVIDFALPEDVIGGHIDIPTLLPLELGAVYSYRIMGTCYALTGSWNAIGLRFFGNSDTKYRSSQAAFSYTTNLDGPQIGQNLADIILHASNNTSNTNNVGICVTGAMVFPKNMDEAAQAIDRQSQFNSDAVSSNQIGYINTAYSFPQTGGLLANPMLIASSSSFGFRKGLRIIVEKLATL